MNSLYHNERFVRNFPTYREAVIHGQTLGGRFWVDTDMRVPSRAEQLLLSEHISLRAARRAAKLATL